MGKNYVLKSIFWQICKIFSDINKSCKLHRSEVNFNKVNNKITSQGYPLNIRIFEVLFTFSLFIKKFKYKCTYHCITIFIQTIFALKDSEQVDCCTCHLSAGGLLIGFYKSIAKTLFYSLNLSVPERGQTLNFNWVFAVFQFSDMSNKY